jgi:hypothetical protein
MRQFLSLFLVLTVLITAGCVEEYTPDTNVTPTKTLVTSTEVPVTPGQVQTPAPTPAPDQMAYVANIQCAIGDLSDKTYHCNGDVRVRSGASHEVQVVARYPDNNTFRSNTVEIGGENALTKPFAIFPDLKYQGQNPSYFVKVDTSLYPVIWSGSTGVAWSNTPGAEDVNLP